MSGSADFGQAPKRTRSSSVAWRRSRARRGSRSARSEQAAMKAEQMPSPTTSSTCDVARANDRTIAHPEVWPKLEKLVDPVTRGDPEAHRDMADERVAKPQ